MFNVHLDSLVDDNGKPVQFVQTLIEMQDEYFGIVQQYCTSYDDLEVPEDFIRDKRAARSMITDDMRKITIPVKFYSKYNSTPDRVKMDDLFKFNMPIFYGSTEDEYALETAKKVYRELFNGDNLIHSYYQYDSKNVFRRAGSNSYIKSGLMIIRIAKGNFKYMKFCKNAHHIDTIGHKLMYRKADKVTAYFNTYKLLQKYGNLDSLYKDPDFNKIDEGWGKTINKLNADISKIRQNLKCDNLEYMKSQLRRYYKITEDETVDAEYKPILKAIEDVQMLEDANNDIVEFMHIPSQLKYGHEKLFPLLKKVMVL